MSRLSFYCVSQHRSIASRQRRRSRGLSVECLEQRLALAGVEFLAHPLSAQSDANGAASVYAVDLNGDNDLDVLFASSNDNRIAWYENTDGKGGFGQQQVITTQADGAKSVYAADLDGDGDMDVVSASMNDDTIAWYENTDGRGAFGHTRDHQSS